MSWYGHDMEGVMITGPAAAAGARESLQERICKGVAFTCVTRVRWQGDRGDNRVTVCSLTGDCRVTICSITGPAAAAGAGESLQERICKGVAAAAELLSQNLMLPTTCVSPLGAILLDDFFCFTPLDNSMTFSVVENETCAAVLSSSCETETEEKLLSHVQVVDSVHWTVNTLRTFCPGAIQICVS